MPVHDSHLPTAALLPCTSLWVCATPFSSMLYLALPTTGVSWLSSLSPLSDTLNLHCLPRPSFARPCRCQLAQLTQSPPTCPDSSAPGRLGAAPDYLHRRGLPGSFASPFGSLHFPKDGLAPLLEAPDQVAQAPDSSPGLASSRLGPLQQSAGSLQPEGHTLSQLSPADSAHLTERQIRGRSPGQLSSQLLGQLPGGLQHKDDEPFEQLPGQLPKQHKAHKVQNPIPRQHKAPAAENPDPNPPVSCSAFHHPP